MPATAGRVRMPANNRVHSSAALQTHGIWQSAIGYDPYAPVGSKKESKPENDPESAYASFKGLLALARITSGGSNADETRGACRKCGRIGHLTYQCRNFLSLKEDEKEGDDSALRAANAVFEKMKKAKEETGSEGDGDESESESSSSDSSVDPEIERIIAERFGKPVSKKVGSLKKRSNSSGDDDGERKHEHERGRHRHRRKKRRRDSDGDESDSDGNRKRGRRGKRRTSDSESSSDESDGHRGRRSRRRKERRSVLSSDSESTSSSSDEDERRKRREKRRRRRRRRRVHKREERY